MKTPLLFDTVVDLEMNDAAYFMIAGMINRLYWRGRLIGAENLPAAGPAVFVGNHLGFMGPLGTICSIHRRFYPWLVVDMIDPHLAAKYLQIDFVEPGSD